MAALAARIASTAESGGAKPRFIGGDMAIATTELITSNAMTKRVLDTWNRDVRIGPNENKMSDGGRDRASLRVEGGISSRVRNQSCQPFAPSHG